MILETRQGKNDPPTPHFPSPFSGKKQDQSDDVAERTGSGAVVGTVALMCCLQEEGELMGRLVTAHWRVVLGSAVMQLLFSPFPLPGACP